MARYDHIDFRPPQNAREAAKRALEIRAEKPESERGMTPVGIARARDLIAGKALSPDTVRRMLSFFERHEVDKSGETWGEQGKGYQAWHGWGGDAGFAWARKVVRQMDAADAADKRMSDAAGADADPGVAVVIPLDEETAAYALPGVDGAHVTLASLGRLGALPMGAVALDVARSVVARWASQTPPLPARLSGMGRFHGAEGEGDAAYLSVDAPGLSAARDALCRMLREAGLTVAASHGFTPHATLAYLPADAPTPDAPCALPLALTLDAAAVWCGADRGTTAALTGDGDPTTMADKRRKAAPKPPAGGAAWVYPLDPDATKPALGGVTVVNSTDPRAVATANAVAAGAVPLPEEEQRKLRAAAEGYFDNLGRTADVVTLRGDSAEITCRETAAVGQKTRNQIARFGEFRGHPQGPFRLDARVFEDIIRNLNATENRCVALDYEHTSETLPDSVAQHGVPALAWITDLEDRGDGTLWGTFEWVDPVAVEHVRAKRYRYLSPAIQFGAVDKETGKPIGARLTSVALTNKPFLDGMAPVTASEKATTASLTPGDVHVPTLPTRTPPMNDEMSAAPMGAADLPKMQPAAAPAGAPVADAKAKAEKEAEGAAIADAKRDGNGNGKFARECAMACGMADMDFDAEGAEDLIVQRIRGIAEQLAAIQEREKAAMGVAAAAMADRVVAAGLAPEGARERLAKLCLSDRETFDTLYPAERVEAAEQAKRMSDAPAAAPAKPTAESLRDAAKPAVTPAARALLSEHVATSAPHPPAVGGDGSVAARSAAREALASRLMSEGKAKTHAEAALMADREISKHLVAPFVGA